MHYIHWPEPWNTPLYGLMHFLNWSAVSLHALCSLNGVMEHSSIFIHSCFHYSDNRADIRKGTRKCNPIAVLYFPYRLHKESSRSYHWSTCSFRPNSKMRKEMQILQFLALKIWYNLMESHSTTLILYIFILTNLDKLMIRINLCIKELSGTALHSLSWPNKSSVSVWGWYLAEQIVLIWFETKFADHIVYYLIRNCFCLLRCAQTT